MGTRNLTMVVYDGETRIAQYGQWDGGPGGQGNTILGFLRGIIKSNGVDKFLKQLRKVRFIDVEKQKEIDAFCKSIGAEGAWVDMEQGRKIDAEYPLLSRDVGGKILECVLNNGDDVIWLHDSSSFVTDSLSCEWAYVVDFDKGVFEVYQGFNKKSLPVGTRFQGDKPDENGYYPVRLMETYSLKKLPTVEAFLEGFEEGDSDD